MTLCTLCVRNMAVTLEIGLDKLEPATELLQQLFTSFEIEAEVQHLGTCICEYCMGDLINICETLRCWRDAQYKLKNMKGGKNELPMELNGEADIDNWNDYNEYNEGEAMDFELVSIDESVNDDTETTTTDNDNRIVDNLSIAIGHDGVILAKVSKNNGKQPKLICFYCDKVFKGVRKIRHHSDISHSRRSYICRKCEETFNSLAKLKEHQHMRQHDNQNVLTAKPTASVKFRCKVCCRYFDRLYCLLRHEDEVHRRECPPKCTCNYCSLKSGHETSYELHMAKHKNFICEFGNCNRRFNRRYQLTRHQLTHNADKSYYPCNACGKLFSYKCNLLVHRRTVHLGERRFQCNVCLGRFSTSSNLKKHRCNPD